MYRITLTADIDDTITEVARQDASTIAEAIKIARRLSGGRKLRTSGISRYVDGPRGRAWIA